jgi:hypothetical protein
MLNLEKYKAPIFPEIPSETVYTQRGESYSALENERWKKGAEIRARFRPFFVMRRRRRHFRGLFNLRPEMCEVSAAAVPKATDAAGRSSAGQRGTPP